MSSSNDQENIERIVAENPDFPSKESDEHLVDMSHLTLNMLGHAHIDLGYRWDFKETVHRIAPDTFRAVLDLMEQAPDFTFCQSQMYLYKAMEREYPEIFRRIRRHWRHESKPCQSTTLVCAPWTRRFQPQAGCLVRPWMTG